MRLERSNCKTNSVEMVFTNMFYMLIPMRVSNQLRTIAENVKQISEISTHI